MMVYGRISIDSADCWLAELVIKDTVVEVVEFESKLSSITSPPIIGTIPSPSKQNPEIKAKIQDAILNHPILKHPLQ